MSTRPVLVDDHLLVRTLLGEEPRSLREPDASLYTTGIWYHRLARAVAVRSVTGPLSRRLGTESPVEARSLLASVVNLPEPIGLLSLRGLGWPMGELLAGGVRLNLMSLEALAAATYLDADICVSERDQNPNLAAAAAERGVRVRVLAA